ncbi:VTT domain-containing protein [Vulgatibacter incomptus]|uniref:DedA-like protein n=1 Tax=Vulgatibacter incomptus TaxID=1391653 RepID=A0A0K1P888_9BACT|nr:VTT domain-containing protein [Vulgatibacter incomptus]AKU89707.1 DedA-like protein [Vulgatibacter incomptus]
MLGIRSPLAYLLVFCFAMFEGPLFLGFIVPGELATILGGVVVSEGRARFLPMAIAASLGATIGDTIGYWMGRRFGPRLMETRPGKWLERTHFTEAQAYLKRRGAWAIFLGRFTTALRVIVPGVAGLAGMPYGRFFAANVTGGIAWGFSMVGLGYVAGAAWERASKLAGAAGLILLIVVFAFFALGWLQRLVAQHHEWFTRVAERALAFAPVAKIRARLSGRAGPLGAGVEPSTALEIRLVVGLVFVFVLGSVLGVLFREVITSGSDELDRRVAESFARSVEAWLVVAAKAAAALAIPAVVVPVAMAVSVLWYLWRKSWDALWILTIGVTGAFVIGELVSLAVARPPPPVAHWATPRTFSFPSRTAFLAVVLDGSLAHVASHTWPGWQSSVRAWTIALFVALLSAASGLVLGIDRLTDVLAGIALGGLWLAFTLTALSIWRRARRRRRHRRRRRAQRERSPE